MVITRLAAGPVARGLAPKLVKRPWIPTEQQWLEILAVAAAEPIRNQVMPALAYDAALRRIRNMSAQWGYQLGCNDDTLLPNVIGQLVLFNRRPP